MINSSQMPKKGGGSELRGQDGVATAFGLRGAAFDLDGTLLKSDHSLSPATIEVCHQLQAKGIWLTLASARPPESVLRIAKVLRSAGPLIALNGAIVFLPDREIVYRRALPSQISRDIFARYRCRGDVSLNVYSAFEWFAARQDARTAAEAAIVGFQPTDLTGYDQSQSADKVLLIVEPREQDRLTAELADYAEEIGVSMSKPAYVEITHRDADKGSALSVAASSAGQSLRGILAAGDGENDISMLSRCGFAVAMAHSPEAAKKIAKVIVGSNDDDSLAGFVRQTFAIAGAATG